MIEKARNTKLAQTYSAVVDKTKLRETELEMLFAADKDGEDGQTFINRLITEGILTDDYDYDHAGRTLRLGKLDDDNYKYSIYIMDGSTEGKEIWKKIQELPDPNVPGNEHLKDMTLLVDVSEQTTENFEVEIPISDATGLQINWDSDANPNNFENVSGYFPKHTYTTEGLYKVKIRGKVKNGVAFGGIEPPPYHLEGPYLPRYIVKIESWGENGFYKFGAFSDALLGEIPLPSRNSFKNVENFDSIFSGCRGLSGSIPERLFINAPNVETFNGTFSNCEYLTGSIPEELFINCPKVKGFYATFFACRGLTGNIPQNLFKNCKNVMYFSSVFSQCNGLTGSIPGKLFENNKRATVFSYVFSYCINLSGEIPENLFSYSKNITNMSGVFSWCRNLSGEIPENLFSNCPNVTNFNYAFNNCSGITNIPANLFSNCLNVTSFERTFFMCTNLIGAAPELWNTHSTANGSGCFYRCTSLSNYSEAQTAGWT